jgi:hypothetical protein
MQQIASMRVVMFACMRLNESLDAYRAKQGCVTLDLLTCDSYEREAVEFMRSIVKFSP